MTDLVRTYLHSLSVADSDTIKTLVTFSCAGLLASLLFMLSGIDLGLGF
jgi:hypothetical protein